MRYVVTALDRHRHYLNRALVEAPSRGFAAMAFEACYQNYTWTRTRKAGAKNVEPAKITIDGEGNWACRVLGRAGRQEGRQ